MRAVEIRSADVFRVLTPRTPNRKVTARKDLHDTTACSKISARDKIQQSQTEKRKTDDGQIPDWLPSRANHNSPCSMHMAGNLTGRRRRLCHENT